MTEGLATARAHGIEPGIDIERAYATRSNSAHKSSMLQDFERDRPPEIDGLLTAVQAFARAAGIATPHLDAITALVIEKARRMGLYPPAVWSYRSSSIAVGGIAHDTRVQRARGGW